MNVSAMIEKNFVRKKRVLLHQVAVHGVMAIKAMQRSSAETVVSRGRHEIQIISVLREDVVRATRSDASALLTLAHWQWLAASSTVNVWRGQTIVI